MNNIALVGYNNILAHNLLELLSLRGYTKNNVKVFDIHSNKDTIASLGEEDIIVEELSNLNPQDFDGIIFTTHENMVTKYALKFASLGAKVINATSALGGIEDIPMIVGGINNSSLSKAKLGVINVPSSGTTQLLTAISGLTAKYHIKAIRLSSYTPADHLGQEGMSELYSSTRKIFMNDTSSAEKAIFSKNIAFNVIPKVGDFIGEETYDEWLYNTEIKQVLGFNTKVCANCAYVPVFIGLGQFVNIETLEDIDAGLISSDLSKSKGVIINNSENNDSFSCLTDVQGEYSVFVSRIKQDMSVENGISLWISGDCYKIAAQNILALLKQFLKKDK